MTNPLVDREDLRRTIAETLDLETREVTDNAHFIEDLGVDSLMALEVMVVIEKKYQVKLDEQQLREITSLSAAFDLIERRVTTTPSAGAA